MSGGGLNAIDWGYKRTVGKMALKLLIEKDDVAMRALYKQELTAPVRRSRGTCAANPSLA